MDSKQMEMLSVKSAIERMVQNYISTYTTAGSYKEFFAAVERLVASFFVSGQIESNYLVRSNPRGDLEIRFTAHKQCTGLTFLLPEKLRWKLDIAKKPETAFKPEAGSIQYDTREDCVRMYDGERWVEVPSDTLDLRRAKPDSVMLEGTIRVNPTGHLEIYKNGKWVQLPNSQHASSQAEQEQPAPIIEETFDPFEAYDRAKKAVRNMS